MKNLIHFLQYGRRKYYRPRPRPHQPTTTTTSTVQEPWGAIRICVPCDLLTTYPCPGDRTSLILSLHLNTNLDVYLVKILRSRLLRIHSKHPIERFLNGRQTCSSAIYRLFPLANKSETVKQNGYYSIKQPRFIKRRAIARWQHPHFLRRSNRCVHHGFHAEADGETTCV